MSCAITLRGVTDPFQHITHFHMSIHLFSLFFLISVSILAFLNAEIVEPVWLLIKWYHMNTTVQSGRSYICKKAVLYLWVCYWPWWLHTYVAQTKCFIRFLLHMLVSGIYYYYFFSLFWSGIRHRLIFYCLNWEVVLQLAYFRFCWWSYIPNRGVPVLNRFTVPSWGRKYSLWAKLPLTHIKVNNNQKLSPFASCLETCKLSTTLFLCFACCSPAVIYVCIRLSFCSRILTYF